MLFYVMVIVYQTNDPGGRLPSIRHICHICMFAVPKGMVLRNDTLKTGIDFT